MERLDPILEAFVNARGEEERRRAADEIVAIALLHVNAVLEDFARREWRPYGADAEDLAASVMIRLLTRLEAFNRTNPVPIESFDDYLRQITRNVIYEYARRAFPQRHRLRNRIHYLVTHDAGFVVTNGPNGLVVALAASGRRVSTASVSNLDSAMLDRDAYDSTRLRDAVATLLQRLGAPARLPAVVSFFHELWHSPAPAVRLDPANDAEAAAASMDRRRFLARLWSEIALLPRRQRVALLLNLREPGGVDAVDLFVILGIASIETIAEVLEIPPAELEQMWTELPLSDNAIAGLLGVHRQQVINLRKSARARLARRLRSDEVSPWRRHEGQHDQTRF
jgi:RNA polymerase sigma factor (sigma-70 family)